MQSRVEGLQKENDKLRAKLESAKVALRRVAAYEFSAGPDDHDIRHCVSIAKVELDNIGEVK